MPDEYHSNVYAVNDHGDDIVVLQCILNGNRHWEQDFWWGTLEELNAKYKEHVESEHKEA